MSTYLYSPEKLQEIKGKMDKNSDFSAKKIADIKVPGLYSVSVGELIGGLAHAELEPYEKNRGGQAICLSTVKKVHNKLHLSSLDQITAKIERDGRKIIGNGHSRSEGLVRRWADGKLTEKERSFLIPLRIIHPSEFAALYENSNSVKNHTPTEKLMNTDYFFGAMIGKMVNLVGEATWNAFIRPKFYKQLSYLFYIYREEAYLKLPQYVKYSDIFGCRKDTTDMELCQKDKAPFKVAPETINNMAAGVAFYAETFTHVQRIVEENKAVTNVKASGKLATSAPFMIMIVSDYMSGRRDFGCSSLVLAKRIVKNVDNLARLVKGLTYSSQPDTFEHEGYIRKILIPKTIV